MTDIRTQLTNDLTANLKAGNKLEVSALRMTLGAIQSQEKAGKTAVTFNDAEILDVIAKQVKQRRESAEVYRTAGVEDTAVREAAEADFLATYLPVAVSEARITEIAEVIIRERREAQGELTQRDFGAVMKDVMAQAKAEGSADGKTVSAVVKNLL